MRAGVPAAASTKRRVTVATPERRCRKLSATRSAVSSAGVLQPERRQRDVEPGQHEILLGEEHRPRPRIRRHGGLGGGVASAHVLLERGGHDAMHDLGVQGHGDQAPLPSSRSVAVTF
jgi:hypothetical protein